MSYLEILFFIGIVVFPLFVVIITEDGLMFFLSVIIYILVGGLIPMAISERSNELKTTSEFVTTPKFSSIDENGLNIVLDDYSHHEFTDYKTIEKWKNGGNVWKVYKYKKCFGPDTSERVIEIRSTKAEM